MIDIKRDKAEMKARGIDQDAEDARILDAWRKDKDGHSLEWYIDKLASPAYKQAMEEDLLHDAELRKQGIMAG